MHASVDTAAISEHLRSWPSSGPNFVYAVLRYGTIGLVYNRFNLVFNQRKVVQYQSRSALSKMRFCDAVLRYGTIDYTK